MFLKIAISFLAATMLSFVVSGIGFLLFHSGQGKYLENMASIFRLNDFWLAFGLWTLFFYFLLALPLCFLSSRKKKHS
jgi:hypothetical protein